MWWKLTLAAVGGFALGIALIAIPIYRSALETRDMRAQYIPKQWTSAGSEWPAFADWLRHGGRKLVMDAAFSAAKDGMSELRSGRRSDLRIWLSSATTNSRPTALRK